MPREQPRFSFPERNFAPSYKRTPRGVQGPPEQFKPLRPTVTATDILPVAYAALQRHSLYDRRYKRYLYDETGSILTLKSTSFAVNLISRASFILRPIPLASGYLIEIDLRSYFPNVRRIEDNTGKTAVINDLDDGLRLWEELSFDPTFSLLVTKDNLRFAELVERYYGFPSGTYKRVKLPYWLGGTELEIGKGVDVVRFNNPAFDAAYPSLYDKLQQETYSLAPIVEVNYFKYRALNTIKDDKKVAATDSLVYATIFGGLYYEFKGIKRAKDVFGKDTKVKDIDLFFDLNLGLGNIKGGVTFDNLFDRIRSDQRLAMTRSRVTGKERIAIMVNTPQSREGSGWGSITRDLKRRSVDVGNDPFANLIESVFDALEGIFPDAKGMLQYVLFNAAGELQDAVPEDVAVNHLIPAPHVKQFGSGLDCIWCHGVSPGAEGWQPMTNDVKTLLRRRIDVFDDFSPRRTRMDPAQKGQSREAFDRDNGGRIYYNQDTIDRLLGLYGGDFTEQIRRARDDQARVYIQATGPWPEGGDQTGIVKLVAQRLADERAQYWYNQIDPRAACIQLGIDPGSAKAELVLQMLLPPDLRAEFDGIILEDARLGLLMEGVPINQARWSLVKAYAMERAQRSPIYRIVRAQWPWPMKP
jgi:hypothetical protein